MTSVELIEDQPQPTTAMPTTAMPTTALDDALGEEAQV